MLASKYTTLRQIAIASVCTFYASAIFADIAIIVHPTNSSVLDKNVIERIYMGKTNNFENGKPAQPINSSNGNNSRENFNKLVIGRTNTQVNAYWSKLLFTGKGTPPTEVGNDQDVIAAVSANEAAIGYVDASAVTANVKVVATFK